MSKILYVASTASHINRFHSPYLTALAEYAEVRTMATGEGVDFPILFDKHFFSLSNFYSILKIRKILKREQFDLLLLNTSLAAFLVRAAMTGWKKRPYVLNVVHGYLFSYPPKKPKDKILLLCERLVRGKTDDIAVMNEEDLKIAEHSALCKKKVYFLKGMGISIPEKPVAENRSLRARYAEERDIICTFVGEMSKRKNQIFLIHAVQALRATGLPVKLLLVGDGKERGALEKEISASRLENVVFLVGETEHVRDYLAVTDIYVSASRSEGLPFNIMEAMEVGLPVLASDTKGQHDLLAAYPNMLYPLDDTDAFCAKIRYLCENRKTGVRAMQYPELQAYTLDRVLPENLKIFTLGLQKNEHTS